MTIPRRLLAVLTAAVLPMAAVPAAAQDPPTCLGMPATIVGTNGDDVLIGTDGDDVIVAHGGDDLIRGKVGDDVVCAGTGDDTVIGGPGNDSLIGGYGNDDLQGNLGDDLLRGGADADLLRGGGGADRLEGGTGNDRATGGDGDDAMFGGDGDDVLPAGAGNDFVRGGDGDDHLLGRPGDDRLFGDAGADLLQGGGGDDELRGGAGDDELRGGTDEDTLLGGDDADALWGGRNPDRLDGGPGGDVIWEMRHHDTHLAEGEPDAAGDVFAFSSIEVTPDGGWMLWRPKPGAIEQGHEGLLTISNLPDGLLMVERIDPERYLLGIAEMPYSWEPAALQSQAIAARTYLASLVANPRWGPMAEYGFDICDWSLCQVYLGAKYGWLEPWEDAVEATAGQVLLYDGAPASTFYHSTSGLTTRSIQDVWTSSPAIPYLQAVPVPEQDSPYGTWWYRLPLDVFVDVLERDGVHLDGPIDVVRTIVTEPGDGPYRVRIRTLEDTTELPISTVQRAFNRHLTGPEYADLLPPLLGRVLHQAALSPTFTVKLRPDGDIGVKGYGWGHQIGLSQYGANALAVLGASAAEILGHFYTGLAPEPDPGMIPDLVDVGLFYENGDQAITLTAEAGYVIRSAGGKVRSGDGAVITITRYGDDAIALHIEG